MPHETPLSSCSSFSSVVPEKKSRVLLVDDSEEVLKVFEQGLQLAGFEVVTAHSGNEAVERLKKTAFEVIASDVTMPGMNGIELLEKIRTVDPDVPVILITGFPQVDSAIKAVEYGALRYLKKPVSLPELVEVVEYAVRIHHLARVKREALEHLANESFGDSKHAALDASFRRALSSLWIAFQPIVSLARRRIFAYEALVRSHESKLCDPIALLEAAETLGAVHVLGRTIRERIASSFSQLDPMSLVFLNLHPLDLADEMLYDVTEPIARYAPRIVLEVTERVRLDGVAGLGWRLAKLRRLGYRMAVDDLGVGYAGLASFVQLEPEFVKIDMTLVRDIHTDPTKARLVRSLLELCRGMGIRVVLEGVETAAEREYLLTMGADLLQGFAFSGPRAGFVKSSEIHFQ